MRQRLAVLALAFCSLVVVAEERRAMTSFGSGQSFLDGDIALQTNYVAGLSDAFNAVASDDDAYRGYASCSAGKNVSQLRAIFEKWLTANPERWDQPGPVLYIAAMKDACK
jgi:hypothetical protein